MRKVFLSYRREDSADICGRIYDRIVMAYGNEQVFRDVDSIPYGVDFRKHLQDAVAKCDVLLAIVGPKWMDVKDVEGDRRLDDDADFVRIEIEAAIHRGIRVIPVLVHNANMPRPKELPDSLREFAFRNAVRVRPDPDFHRDIERLLKGIQSQDGNDSESLSHFSVSQAEPFGGEDASRSSIVVTPGGSDFDPEWNAVLNQNIPSETGTIESAIDDAVREFDEKIQDLKSCGREISLEDIVGIASLAITNGAGLYNFSEYGRIACTRIYHRGARETLRLLPNHASRPTRVPSRNVDLAAEWLGTIIKNTPVVRKSIADEVGWELRYAFDALPRIPLLDAIHDFVSAARSSDDRIHNLSRLIGRVLQQSQQLPLSESAYVLRHVTQLLFWLFDDVELSAAVDCRHYRNQMQSIVEAYPRIMRSNIAHVVKDCTKSLVNLSTELAGDG